MRVAIAEDAVLLREGLIRLLTEHDFEVVAAVENGEDLVTAVVRERPDVSIVDVRMPPTFRDEGLRAAIEARRRVPNTPIVVFSQYVEERYAAELLEGGTTGVGYLLKDRVADVREFVTAVRRVAHGGTVLDPEVVAQLVTRRRRERPDVSIVDVRMPPTFRDEGLRAAIEARRRVPNTPIVVFSQYVEERYAAELLEGGTTGVGYLLKDRVADVREFVTAVRRVAHGGTVLDPEVVAQLVTRRRRDERLSSLTQREQEVLALMAEGRTNNAIADALFVSEGTVEKHIRGIFSKLGLEDAESVHRRVLAVLTFLRLGHETP